MDTEVPLDTEVALDTLSKVIDGQVTYRDLTGLKQSDVDKLIRLGLTAMQTHRFKQAADLFGMAYGFASDRPEYLLFRAYALAEFDGPEATLEVGRYLDLDDIPTEDRIRALLVDARLHYESDRDRAQDRISEAKSLSDDGDQAEKTAFEEMGR